MATKTHRMQSIPHSHAQRWLLAHDIRDKRRLQRVWRFLRQEGVRLQYSVYLLAGTLTENTRIWGLGTQFNDDGNTLCDAFMDQLRQADQGTEPSTEPDDKRLSFL